VAGEGGPRLIKSGRKGWREAMSDEDLRAELERLRYGLGRFPVENTAFKKKSLK
jgi:hypothetical protein